LLLPLLIKPSSFSNNLSISISSTVGAFSTEIDSDTVAIVWLDCCVSVGLEVLAASSLLTKETKIKSPSLFIKIE